MCDLQQDPSVWTSVCPPAHPLDEDIPSHCPQEVTHQMWVFPGCGRATPTLFPTWWPRAMVPGYRGFHWCVRPLYTWELKEMHCSSRKLLPSGGHSWEVRRRGGRLQEELGPTKAFLSRLSRKWPQPEGWPLRSVSQSHSLGKERGQAEGQLPSLRCPNVLAVLVLWAGPFHLAATPAFSQPLSL